MKRKRRGRSYMGMPWEVIRSRQFALLTGTALKMLIEIRAQYNGYNNGNLTATWSQLHARGWNSKETVNMALRELLYYGWINQVRKGKKLGGTHFPSLYEITWEARNDCGKGIPGTIRPSDDWKTPRAPWRRPERVRKKAQVQEPSLAGTENVAVQVRNANAA